ncbi:hypothetical protein [Maritimibacter dapengensis]|uniref:DUF4345 domain-containing protein n=1 Tax=Maritimibacter dapengensis TaxID=2836868 RepID=A0ABS6SYE1_9RHOB|nr:hypothetical protein [Maritimibacter dapengensis]MBV7377989.1 hypothetical protein [Maritimibacter dapengensis]
MSFRHLTLLAFLLSCALTAGMVLFPFVFFWLFGLEQDVAATVMLRRCGMLFAGIAILLWGARRAKGATQVVFARGMVVMMGGLALLGLTEFIAGRVGPGIFVAGVVEVAFAIGFMPYIRRRF